MSTRTALRPQVVINNGDMSANITSDPTVLQSLSCGSYEIVWSGTSPVGTLSFQVSDDYKLTPAGTVENAGHWVTAPVSVSGATVTSIAVTGNSGTGFIEILGTGAYAVRLVYTASSGSGTMTATINGKVS